MGTHVKAYLEARAEGAGPGSADLAQAIADLSRTRLAVLGVLDRCHAAQAAEAAPERAAMEQTAQTLGAVVRELTNALQASREAQTALDQLRAVETHLASNFGG